MPSYPTSVFSPTSRSAGQVIQPAHINDLQDEVVAIEQGLTQGTAPLNSSNSTVANLQVTGGCTAAGLRVTSTASFASSVTFEGNVTISGTLTSATAPPDAVSVTGSTTNIASNSTTPLTWPTQSILTNSSMHSTASDADKFFPQSTGVYVFATSLRLNSTPAPTSTAAFSVYVKDSSGARIALGVTASAGDHQPIVGAYALKRFDVVGSTQWLRVVAKHTVGSTSSLPGNDCHVHFYKL